MHFVQMTTFRALLTDSARVGFIMGAGDVISQTWVEKRDLRNIDVNRMLRFASVGIIFVGPVLKTWYGTLDKFVPKTDPPFKRGLKKMALDQLVFTPGFVASVLGVIGLANGQTRAQIKETLREDYFMILSRNYMLWPAAQIINFSVVPINYQVLFAQFVAVIWNTYLSMKLNEEKK
ncbi:mpv17-like protein [Rhagoletis pomonella]|uniref:mpv17-like protein n=1 Tax=Rhagoletis pomonella TaxID=28610 RepID=UPI00177F259A|nr:mpv17-like protein [Rhagoletis pomonella]